MSSRFLAQRYQALRRNPMGTVFDKASRYDDVINLSIGDPDLSTPGVIVEEAFRDVRQGHTKYTDPRGYPQLRDEIRGFYREEYGVSLADGQVMVTTAGLVAMYLAMEALLDPGDEVIIPDPCFSPYPVQVELARGVPVFLPTYGGEGFRIDVDRLRTLVTPKTKAILINTPNNPTGACLTRENLEALAAFCVERDLVVLADDIYTFYSFDRDFVPIMSLPGMGERTVTVNSFSKNFLMTGFRVGNLVAPPEIIRVIQDINESVVFTAPAPSQRAALHALRHRGEYRAEIVEAFRQRMDYAAGRINALARMSVPAPQGSIYLFPDVSATGLDSGQVCTRILEEAHVLTLPGRAFGACGEGHLRIACTVGLAQLEEAFDRIARMPLFQ